MTTHDWPTLPERLCNEHTEWGQGDPLYLTLRREAAAAIKALDERIAELYDEVTLAARVSNLEDENAELRSTIEVANVAIEQKDIYTAGVVEERDRLSSRLEAVTDLLRGDVHFVPREAIDAALKGER